MEELALLAETLYLPVQALDLRLQDRDSGLLTLVLGWHLPFEASRQGPTELRVQNHRDQGDE